MKCLTSFKKIISVLLICLLFCSVFSVSQYQVERKFFSEDTFSVKKVQIDVHCISSEEIIQESKTSDSLTNFLTATFVAGFFLCLISKIKAGFMCAKHTELWQMITYIQKKDGKKRTATI